MGFEIVKKLNEEEANVVFCSKDKANVESAVERLGKPRNVHGLICDNSSRESLINFFESAKSILGKYNGLVYNTGGPKPGTFNELTEDDYLSAYKLLSESAFIATKKFLEAAELGSSIVYMTSLAVKEPIKNLILSNSLRLSVIGLAKTLSKELGNKYRFNAVLPGYILTDRLKSLIENEAKRRSLPIEVVEKEYLKEVPMGRFGRPEEVAYLVLFLLSEYSSYLNGVSIAIDGGMSRGIF